MMCLLRAVVSTCTSMCSNVFFVNASQDSDYLRKRLHSKLMEIGILEKIDINKFV